MALNSLSADNKNKTIFKYCSQFLLAVGIRVSAISISTGMGISAIGSIRISTVGIGGISLGGGIKSLGDGVQTGAGAEGNSVAVGQVGFSFSLSLCGPLAIMVGIGIGSISIGTMGSIGVATVGIGGISLGRGIKTLGDGVQTGAGAEGNSVTVGQVGFSLSGPLAIMVGIGGISNSLGHSIKSLGDGVKSGAGAEGNSSIGVGTIGSNIGVCAVGSSIGICPIGKCIGWISLSPHGSNKASLKKYKYVQFSE